MMAPENLEVRSQSLGSTEVLSVTGEVGSATVDALAGAIRDGLAGAPETMVVDLSEVAAFGARGLGVLLAADDRARRLDCRLVVVPGTGPVRRLLDGAGADQRLTVAS